MRRRLWQYIHKSCILNKSNCAALQLMYGSASVARPRHWPLTASLITGPNMLTSHVVSSLVHPPPPSTPVRLCSRRSSVPGYRLSLSPASCYAVSRSAAGACACRHGELLASQTGSRGGGVAVGRADPDKGKSGRGPCREMKYRQFGRRQRQRRQ